MSRDNYLGLDVNRIGPGDYVVEGHWEVKHVYYGTKKHWEATSRNRHDVRLHADTFWDIKAQINRVENRR